MVELPANASRALRGGGDLRLAAHPGGQPVGGCVVPGELGGPVAAQRLGEDGGAGAHRGKPGLE